MANPEGWCQEDWWEIFFTALYCYKLFWRRLMAVLFTKDSTQGDATVLLLKKLLFLTVGFLLLNKSFQTNSWISWKMTGCVQHGDHIELFGCSVWLCRAYKLCLSIIYLTCWTDFHRLHWLDVCLLLKLKQCGHFDERKQSEEFYVNIIDIIIGIFIKSNWSKIYMVWPYLSCVFTRCAK